MVKGISRRVVVVDAPDEKLFEQAIFIVRNDVPEEGVTSRALVQEARRLARDCSTERRFRPVISPQMGAFLGAASVGSAWILATLLT